MSAWNEGKWGEGAWGDNDCLRDQFAMAALTGLSSGGAWRDFTNARMAELSYELADAMMIERVRIDEDEI